MAQQAEIRGYSAKHASRSVGRAPVLLAWSIDLALALMACALALQLLHISPAPRKQWILAIAAAVGVFGPLLRRLAHATLGERAWGLRSIDGTLTSISSDPGKTALTGGILTLTAVVALILSINSVAGRSPIWAHAETERLQPFLPVTDPTWTIDAFFYTLGAWPKNYKGRPVFYSIPYQKGPPVQFVPQIDAHWDTGVRVTLEGPQTPLAFQSGARTRDQLRSCMTASPITLDGGSLGEFPCLQLRERTLQRHLKAMSALKPISWRVRWFIVENAAIPPDEQAQGIHLEAIGRKFAQSRYILVTAKGTNETIIANYPALGEDAMHARETVEKVVSSLRVSDDLNQGRAWADSQIEHTRLDDLKRITDPAKLTDRLAQIEAVLLSKISVEPKTYDAYFHLGGVAMMIAREGARQKEPEWLAASMMIGSLLRYAKDIAPQDARTTQLENLYIESKKL